MPSHWLLKSNIVTQKLVTYAVLYLEFYFFVLFFGGEEGGGDGGGGILVHIPTVYLGGTEGPLPYFGVLSEKVLEFTKFRCFKNAFLSLV